MIAERPADVPVRPPDAGEPDGRPGVVDPLGEIAVALGELRITGARDLAARAGRIHPELTAAGLRVLFEVRRAECIQASEVGSATQMDKSSVSRQVKLLCALGLLDSRPDPRDGRAALLEVTPAAQARLSALVTEAVAEQRARFDGVPPEDVATFLRVLRRYNDAARESQSSA